MGVQVLTILLTSPIALSNAQYYTLQNTYTHLKDASGQTVSRSLGDVNSSDKEAILLCTDMLPPSDARLRLHQRATLCSGPHHNCVLASRVSHAHDTMDRARLVEFGQWRKNRFLFLCLCLFIFSFSAYFMFVLILNFISYQKNPSKVY